jgi:protein ImuB
VAIVEQTGNRQVLTHVTPKAAKQGLQAGMVLGDALAICPTLKTRAAEPHLDHGFLKSLARYCYRYGPLIVLEPPDHVLLDMTGATHLLGGDEAALKRMAHDFDRLGLSLTTALAPTPEAARALTRAGANGAVIVAGAAGSERLRTALAALPVASLGAGPDTNALLNRLGLGTIGALYGLARAALRRRFGHDLTDRLDRALGRTREPLDFLAFRPPYRAGLGFAEPLLDLGQIEQAAARMLEQLCQRLEGRQRGARRVELNIERTESTRQTLAIGLARPSRDAGHMLALLKPRLDLLEAPFGIDALSVHATATGPIEDHGPRFVHERDNSRKAEQLAGLIDRLANRLGFDKVVVFSPNDSHIPERCVQVQPAQFATMRPAWRTQRIIRPVSLFAAPLMLPDFDRTGFAFDGQHHETGATLGPERIEPEWWWDDPAWRQGPRDYWWVETETGLRFWIFRPRNDHLKRWYLHGVGP